MFFSLPLLTSSLLFSQKIFADCFFFGNRGTIFDVNSSERVWKDSPNKLLDSIALIRDTKSDSIFYWTTFLPNLTGVHV